MYPSRPSIDLSGTEGPVGWQRKRGSYENKGLFFDLAAGVFVSKVSRKIVSLKPGDQDPHH
jgi:hypothetical protein